MPKFFFSMILFTAHFVFFNIARAQESKSVDSQEKSVLDQLPISHDSKNQASVSQTPEAQESIPPALTAPLHLASMPELDERLLASVHESSATVPAAKTNEVEVVEEVKTAEPEVEGQLKTIQ
jgi:hypothetical protein